MTLPSGIPIDELDPSIRPAACEHCRKAGDAGPCHRLFAPGHGQGL